jgi:Fe-S cluster assembly protein SufD
MDKNVEKVDQYVAEFETFEKNAPAAPQWIHNVRRDAIKNFSQLGFPTTRNEEWKYTNVSPLVKTELRFPEKQASRVKKENVLFNDLSDDQPWHRIVCVNGYVKDDLSAQAILPNGVRFGSLAKALATESELVQKHLAHYAQYDLNAFTALSTAFIEDGIFLYVPDGVVIEQPIHLAFISESPNGGTISHPRNLIVLGKNSQATIVETYQSLSSKNNDTYFTNAVTEIVLGEDAILEHSRVDKESSNAFHISTTRVAQSANSRYGCTSVMAGGKLTRNNHEIVLQGEHAECRLDGLYLARGAQHIDNHTMVDHRVPNCASREYYKGIMDGESRAVFNGKVFVRQDAQKTDAQQTNKNLLLSDNAVVDTKPQLEIYADDVKCTHGATVGQLDEDSIFYLRARGIGTETARRMLTYGFATEIIETIALESVRQYLENSLSEDFHIG